ncbi:hypothetical protein AB0J42_32560 [Nonomuraea sp. NPDC049649]|uniref:hypothetical protein n=1 Tax=Nonomuraea sp. NPDC049649 TaxID=3155776 RepID=UPI00341834FC
MTLQELANQYPNWVIWRGVGETGPGSWYATRRGRRLSHAQLRAGMAQTVAGDDEDALVQELQRQHELAFQFSRNTWTGS